MNTYIAAKNRNCSIEPAVSAKKQAVDLAQRIYNLRRRREGALERVSDLFHDPAWDIVLDLFIASGTGNFLSVSSVCHGSGVAETTGLRTLRALQQRGIIIETFSELDKRMRYLALSDEFQLKMTNLLLDM